MTIPVLLSPKIDFVLKKGIEQGAKKEKIEIEKNLIKNGLDDDFIIETTGLSIEEVREIRKEQNGL